MGLCPVCRTRPRRGLGLYCRECQADYQRARRATRRAGAPVKEATPPELDVDLEGATRVVVTSAQNNTPVHRPFLAVLKRYAKDTDARLVVIPTRYHNPTSHWGARAQQEEHWADEVQPWLCNQRKRLGPNLVLLADVKTQPTAASPLTGFEGMTGTESAILGHQRMQLRTVAAPTGRMAKLLSTTGAVTRRNATDTKAGRVADFHYFLGAVVVELEGKRFHLRQLNAHRKTGEFVDLDKHWTARGARRAPPAAALVLGDAHVGSVDPQVDLATFGAGGIVPTLNPRVLVWHDLLDGMAVNPHERADPFLAVARRGQADDVRAEVERAVRWAVDRTHGRASVVVPANHDSFLRRWLAATDWRTDPTNAAFYLETALASVRSARMTPGGPAYDDPFAHWVERCRGKADIRCLSRGESYAVHGIEVGAHGHEGPNGSRGSLRNLSRLGSKIITGHSHTPGIEGGHYQAGTSTLLRLGYNAGGPSSWLHAHVVVYATGARAMLIIVDGHWRG